MKRFVYFFAALTVFVFCIASCGQYDDTEIRQRLDKLEGSTINTINQQISAIEGSITKLQSVDAGITDLITKLQESDVILSDIDAMLFDSIVKINNGIDMLRSYTDSCRQSDKDWISTTYSTIEKQDSIIDMLFWLEYAMYYIQEELYDSILFKTDQLSVAIDQSIISVMSWVNESLCGYYNIAETDAKLALLEYEMNMYDSVAFEEILELQKVLILVKSDLTAEYKQAIEDAIETNNGTIDGKIAGEIKAVNTRIGDEVAAINLRVDALSFRVDELEESVQAIKDEMAKKLSISFTEDSISCSVGDIVTIGYTITNGTADAAVYTLGENGWSATVTKLTATTGTITVTAPTPIINGNILVFLNDQDKSVIKALNFIEGSMTISTDVVEVGAAGGNVSVNIDTDLQYTVSVEDGVTWLHNATIATRSAMRHESVTLTADASTLAFPRNAVVRLLNMSGAVIAQYTIRQAGTVSSHEYVDLGLSVKWATCNVGATRPEEYGDYFAWGAIEPWYEPGYAQSSWEDIVWKTGKSGGYALENAPYYKLNEEFMTNQWTKYLGSTTSEYKHPSATDTDALKTVLDLEDDAAHMNWGGDWRMPTWDEYNELITDNCTWTWYGKGNALFGGVAGYKVVSKVPGYEGNFIFLPAAGDRTFTYLDGVGSYGAYWSSSLYESSSYGARYLYFNSGGSNAYYYDRYYGQSVRPVCP